MKVSSLNKSVLGLCVFLHTVTALDAVQIWLSNTCQGTSHSWLAIDNGDKSICQTISTTLAGGGISWVAFATEASFHLLYTAASCPASAPAVIVSPGTANTACQRFVPGSGNHILSVGVLDTTPNAQAVNGEPAGNSTAQFGLGEVPSSVQILFGSKTFSFGDMTIGSNTVTQPLYDEYLAARNDLRTVWVSGAPTGAVKYAGSGINYDVRYYDTQKIANPYSQFDAANGDLLAAMLDRLYHYLYFNGRCSASVGLKTNLGSTVMTVSVSFCEAAS